MGEGDEIGLIGQILAQEGVAVLVDDTLRNASYKISPSFV